MAQARKTRHRSTPLLGARVHFAREAMRLGDGAMAVVSGRLYMSHNDKEGQPRLASKQPEGLRLKYDGFTLADERTNRLGKHCLPLLQYFYACGHVVVDRGCRP